MQTDFEPFGLESWPVLETDKEIPVSIGMEVIFSAIHLAVIQ